MPAHARIYRPTPAEVDDACSVLLARTPGESKRYVKAAELVVGGAIEFDDASGWSVASQSKPGGKAPARYHVTPTTCECWDHQHSGGMACKHISAIQLYMRIIAAKLDASLRPPANAEATATAISWRMMAELGPDDAAACAEYVAAQPVDRRLEVLPGSAENRRNVYDRATHTGICMAQQQPGGAWRPCNPVDTVAWCRWLGAQQPVEVEVAAEVQPATAHQNMAPAMMFWNGEPVSPEDMEPTPGDSLVESPYKYDRRNAARYGRAPVLQLQALATQRRREAQAQHAADAAMVDQLDRAAQR